MNRKERYVETKTVHSFADIFVEARSGDAVCITTNGCVKKDGKAVMGKGIAYQACNLFPSIDEKLGSYIKEYGNRAFNLGLWSFNGKHIRVFSYPTKYHWKDHSDITLIYKSAEQLMEMADKFKPNKILMPPPGCGCGSLSWELVENWISLILDDRFVVYLGGK
jgi:hypothetical protein